MMKDLPIGARGLARYQWKGKRSGHIWNWIKRDDGKVIFWDAQTGRMVPGSEYLKDAKRGSFRWACLADARPPDSVLNIVSIEEPPRVDPR